MPDNLAPIGLSTYARLSHLAQTVLALKRNQLANESELYVFSDAPRPGDEEKVAAVREYLRTIDGFKAVHIVERTENNRVANNRGGMRMLLDKYGKMIFLEEDVVTAPGFLLYMNTALKRYEDEKQVFSITGWCPKLNQAELLEEGSTFFIPRSCAWGLGIWKDRFEKINPISIEDMAALQGDSIAMRRIHRQMGRDILPMMQAESLGQINALDIRCCYHQAVTGELTLYPYPSLIRNIGLDGSGEHCKERPVEIDGEIRSDIGSGYQFPDRISVDEKVAEIYVRSVIRKASLLNKIKSFLNVILK